MKVWIDGKMLEKAQAKVSVFDHGLLYGDGVFEGIRVYGGRIFRCRAHLDRLFASAKCIRLAIPISWQEIQDAMIQTIQANGLVDGYIRLVVTRGEGTLGLDPNKCPRPSVFVIADQIALYPRKMYEEGMAVIIAKTRRTSDIMLPPSVKSLNYLNNILAKMEAIDAGVCEAIMLNDRDEVAEATGDNVFLVKNGQVVTPSPEAGILIGVTRQLVIDLCAELGIPLAQRPVHVEDIRQADECFLTGTAAEIIAVTQVDGLAIGTGKPGPVTMRLQQSFHEMIASGRFE
jgi:branched-chain amino acid aminotransferase